MMLLKISGRLFHCQVSFLLQALFNSLTAELHFSRISNFDYKVLLSNGCAKIIGNFDAKVEQEIKIEPKDWMPDAYRKTVIRQISQHAHSEIVGMLPEANWITRAPSLKEKPFCCKGSGRSRAWVVFILCGRNIKYYPRGNDEQLLQWKAKYSSIFNYPTLSWADMGAIGWLVDGAAIMNQVPFAVHPMGLMQEAMVRICKEESFHQRQGFEILLTLCRGSKEQKEMAQDALNRWWWPSLMMFGPNDDNHRIQRKA